MDSFTHSTKEIFHTDGFIHLHTHRLRPSKAPFCLGCCCNKIFFSSLVISTGENDFILGRSIIEQYKSRAQLRRLRKEPFVQAKASRTHLRAAAPGNGTGAAAFQGDYAKRHLQITGGGVGGGGREEVGGGGRGTGETASTARFKSRREAASREGSPRKAGTGEPCRQPEGEGRRGGNEGTARGGRGSHVPQPRGRCAEPPGTAMGRGEAGPPPPSVSPPRPAARCPPPPRSIERCPRRSRTVTHLALRSAPLSPALAAVPVGLPPPLRAQPPPEPLRAASPGRCGSAEDAAVVRPRGGLGSATRCPGSQARRLRPQHRLCDNGGLPTPPCEGAQRLLAAAAGGSHRRHAGATKMAAGIGGRVWRAWVQNGPRGLARPAAPSLDEDGGWPRDRGFSAGLKGRGTVSCHPSSG